MQKRFNTLLTSIGISRVMAEQHWKFLTYQYEQPQRHYHNLVHVGKCLDHLDDEIDGGNLSFDPRVVELALWFHDLIYIPGCKDNELQCAVLSNHILQDSVIGSKEQRKVYDCILATKHSVQETDTNQMITCDIDLASLGCPWNEFYANNRCIAREYQGYVPMKDFWEGNHKLLHSFLERDHIYRTVYFRNKFEEQARENIGQWIECTGGGFIGL